MQLTLDAKSEKVVQREIELGHFREPAEVVAQALALLQDQQDWLKERRVWLNERLERSFAQVKRGEVVDEAGLRAHLDELRRQHPGKE